MAKRLYDVNSNPDEFLAALDTEMGVSATANILDRVGVIRRSEELYIIWSTPYSVLRTGLEEALRKREPIGSVEIPDGIGITVAPQQIDAPDIIKVVVERGSREIPPISSDLRPRELSTRMGAKRLIHSGVVLFPCSAFAPGASVTVTAIPESGSNFVRTITPEELERIK